MERKSKLKTYNYLARKIGAHAVKITNLKHSGHLGSSLSMADIVVVLYESILKVNPEDPSWTERDRFILSKGHAAACVYAILAEVGFIPKEWLNTYYCDDGKLCGYTSHHVPGIEFSTGSLGHGLPVGVGMAIAAKHSNKKYRIFVLMSDGDLNEGFTWEAMMFASQHNLDNLIAIVDYNKIQALGPTKDIIDLEPLEKKVFDFGWEVKVIDGHNYIQIEETLLQVPFKNNKPSFVIAHTVKGKGLGFLENTVKSHYECVPDKNLRKH